MLYLEQIDAAGGEGHVPAHDRHVGHHLEVGPAERKTRVNKRSGKPSVIGGKTTAEYYPDTHNTRTKQTQSHSITDSLGDDLEGLLHEGDGLAGDLGVGGICVASDGLGGRQPGAGHAFRQTQLVPVRVCKVSWWVINRYVSEMARAKKDFCPLINYTSRK